MKILYITRHFNHSGYIILERLIKEGFQIEGILLHQDNNKWRKKIYRPILIAFYELKCRYYRCKPLKTTASEEYLAKQNNIPVIFTESIKSDSFYNSLLHIEPDIIVLGGGWHEVIPKRVYSFPRMGCINTHPSLLPEFRGTSITRWQVLNGLSRSGTTIHYVDENLDTGGVLAQNKVEISNNVTPQELFKILGTVGADLMVSLLRRFNQSGKQITITTEHNKQYYNYYKKWEWSENNLRIDWSKSFKEIHYFVLANTQESYEYLGPHFSYNNKRYILRRTKLHPYNEIFNNYKEGNESSIKVVRVQNGSIFAHRKGEEYILEIVQLQKYDRAYKFRRAWTASSLLDVNSQDMMRFQDEK